MSYQDRSKLNSGALGRFNAKSPTSLNPASNKDLTEIAGPTNLHAPFSMVMDLKQNARISKATNKTRAAAIESLTNVALYHINLRESQMKAELLIADHERTHEIKTAQKRIVREAIETHADELFDFELNVGESEQRKIEALETRLAAGQIRQDFFDAQMERVLQSSTQQLNMGAYYFEQLVDDFMKKIEGLAFR